mgnify:FL=1
MGKTIMFVSHDIGAINNFCEKTAWIRGGSLQVIGESSVVTSGYFSFMNYGLESSFQSELADVFQSQNIDTKNIHWSSIAGRDNFGDRGVCITHVSLQSHDSGKRVDVLRGGEKVELFVKMLVTQNISNPIVGFTLKNRLGNSVFGANSYIYRKSSAIGLFETKKNKIIRYEFTFPRLAHGEYVFSLAIADGTQLNHLQHHWVHDAYSVSIRPDSESGFMDWMYCLEDILIEEVVEK